MARGVFVEQRVVEQQPGLGNRRARAARARPRRAGRPPSSVSRAAQHRLLPARPKLHDAAGFKSQREVLDQRAAVTERLRRAHRALHAAAIGNREHFLGGQVRHERDARSGSSTRRSPRCVRPASPTVRSVPGPRVSAAPGTAGDSADRCAPPAPTDVLLPRGHRIGPIETAHARDGVPQRATAARRPARRETPSPPTPRRRPRSPPSSSDSGKSIHGTAMTPRDVACCSAPTRSAGSCWSRSGLLRIDRQHGVPRLRVLRQRFGSQFEKWLKLSRARDETARAGAPRRPRSLPRAQRPHRTPGRDAPDQRRRLERHAAVHERSDDQQPLSRLHVERDSNGELRIRDRALDR